MKREADLKRRLRGLETLGEAVGAMKSLSAHHFRDARAGVDPAREYRAGVERILGWTRAHIAAGPGPAGLLVVGGELGLCGSYNARLIAAAVAHRGELGAGPTFCAGRRAALLAERQGLEIARAYDAPTSVRGIPEMLLRLAEDLLTTYVQNGLSCLDVVSSRFGGVGVEQPVVAQLLPLASAHVAGGPSTRFVGAERLASVAVREFLYIVLYDLLVDGLASEHSARLVATQSAETWLDERADRLRRGLASTRRESSTQEMIEIAGGARARRGA
jgi:F-type H+-transporting ATPase subunit gamma